jgi:hypothetical protein
LHAGKSDPKKLSSTSHCVDFVEKYQCWFPADGGLSATCIKSNKWGSQHSYSKAGSATNISVLPAALVVDPLPHEALFANLVASYLVGANQDK